MEESFQSGYSAMYQRGSWLICKLDAKELHNESFHLWKMRSERIGTPNTLVKDFRMSTGVND